MTSKKSTFPCGRPISGPVAPSTSGSETLELRKRLEEYQEENDLRQSGARNRIIDVILDEPAHFTGSDLVKKVQSEHPTIGAATVYRTLPLLVEAGVLRESLNDSSGQTVYELAGTDHHDHIVCLDCNAIIEFHEEQIESLQDQAVAKLGFKPARHKHVVYARCEYRKRR